MKKRTLGIIVLLIIVGLFYYFFLVPNFKECKKNTGEWRSCIQWLIK